MSAVPPTPAGDRFYVCSLSAHVCDVTKLCDVLLVCRCDGHTNRLEGLHDILIDHIHAADCHFLPAEWVQELVVVVEVLHRVEATGGCSTQARDKGMGKGSAEG
jgi:hypothetical protein